jgi:isopentenyl-diphosphate delta-isomerase
MEKLKAHQEGVLHRAFSVFIFNSKGELLLQQRALDKYHSAGLWSNTCCSHPRPGEDSLEAAKRRLMEEMGINTELDFSYKFIYKRAFDNGLIEHEYDHIFVGLSDELPTINTAEVASYKYMSPMDIRKHMYLNTAEYTYWFLISFDHLMSNLTRMPKYKAS